MFKKILGTILCAAIACAALTGCAGSGKKKVGISMPTQDLQRWNQDGSYMKEKFEAAGYEVDLQYAGNKADVQLSQVEDMINTNCKVIVIATQNPIEQEGTYELSEAQQDRFLLKEVITYPNVNEEVEILNRIESDVFTASGAVATIEDIEFLQDLCKRVYISPAIKKYIVDIVQATREPKRYISANLADYVAMGSSTRAAIAFMEVSKAVALIQGRAYVTPDDVKAMRHEVMRHRIMLNFAAIADGVKEEQIIDAIVGAIVTP